MFLFLLDFGEEEVEGKVCVFVCACIFFFFFGEWLFLFGDLSI